jgi:hypothetical protein
MDMKKQAAAKASRAKPRKTSTTKKAPAKKSLSQKAAPKPKRTKPDRDPRLPAVGTVMTRTFKGKEISVKVLEGGFEYEGETYRSLSGLARHITGYMISGPVFFKLVEPKRPKPTKVKS